MDKFNRITKKTISLLLTASITLGSAAGGMTSLPVYAKNAKTTKTEKKAKYISEVFIAYGKTENEAVKWLTDNGWEPITGSRDFNAGKNSSGNKAVASVMGIKRTSDPKKAVTDMAVMNMSGGYDFPGYEDILNEKRDEIDAFIYSFMPTIEEFRANYNGEGSETGQMKAELAYELLNRFYDGGSEEKYRKNDTGTPLGDLFLDPLMQEGAGEGSGDLEQIILEGSTPAVVAIENALALAADTSEDSWLDRLSFLTMDELQENVGTYVPEAEGLDVAPSAVMNYYLAEYGDSADILAEQWENVHEKIAWYEAFSSEHDLDIHEGESEEEYQARYDEIMAELRADEDQNAAEIREYDDVSVLKNGLDMVSYPGEWGETLGDFFNPAGDSDYAAETESYLPMAVALSEGQRSAISVLPLDKLLRVGFFGEETDGGLFPDVDELFEGYDSISVYSGVNRGIFREGVALTSEALMADSKGEAPAVSYETSGAYRAVYISAMALGLLLVATGAALIGRAIRLKNVHNNYLRAQARELGLSGLSNDLEEDLEEVASELSNGGSSNSVGSGAGSAGAGVGSAGEAGAALDNLIPANNNLLADLGNNAGEVGGNFGLGEGVIRNEAVADAVNNNLPVSSNVKDIKEGTNIKGRMIAGCILAGIGAVILAYGIVAKITEAKHQVAVYKNKEFTKIPTMIVDVDNIVTYVENKDGEKVRCIELDQYTYYEAVRCNRQQVGELSKWQKGVSDYKKLGCGDIADLNADHGLEWLALYTVKGAPKGDAPILADSLKLAFGEKNKPDLDTPSLHYFGGQVRVDLADRAYCYSNKNGAMYFSWSLEKAA